MRWEGTWAKAVRGHVAPVRAEKKGEKKNRKDLNSVVARVVSSSNFPIPFPSLDYFLSFIPSLLLLLRDYFLVEALVPRSHDGVLAGHAAIEGTIELGSESEFIEIG